MLKGFFDTLLKVTDPRPKYVGSRCLVEKHTVGGCDRCMQACPHDAVRITDHVEILEDACTGCGLCVQACPSGALEYNLVPMLGALKDQGIRANDAPEAVPARLKCSKVPGDGHTVECLGRISPAMVLASAAWGQSLELIRHDCATCKLGGPSVPQSVASVLEIARAYRETLPGPALEARVTQWEDTGTPTAGAPAPARAVSRREAMGALFQSGKRGVAEVIPENPLPGVDTSIAPPRIPDEWSWRKRALKPRPDDQAAQYWPAPTVNDHCIFCPVCENVCPTEAVHRTRGEDGTYRVTLEVAACTGCNACVISCPPNAMTLEPKWTFEKLNETVVLKEGDGLEG